MIISRKALFLYSVAVLAVGSCAKRLTNDTSFSGTERIRIPVSQVPLYADLTGYNLTTSGEESVTRSVVEECVTLESLLDQNKTETRTNGDYKVMMIPFKQNKEDFYTLIYSATHDPIANQVMPTRVKKFFLSGTSLSQSSETYELVVVMMTSADYADIHPEFSWFDKPGYSGVIFFCTPEGELLQTCDYIDGLILPTRMLTPESSENDINEKTKYISLIEPSNTRSSWDIPGFSDGWAGFGRWGSVNVGFTPLEPKTGGGTGPGGNDSNPTTPGSDNAPPGTTQDRQWDNFGIGIILPTVPPELGQWFTIKLTSNTDDVQMVGSGCYEKGTIINIDYDLGFMVEEAIFSHWTGDFRMEKKAQLNHMVTKDVESTAYFNVIKAPCHNAETNLTNPLKEMRVAPTATGNYLKGIYHAVVRRYDAKTGGPIYHWGLDLAAEPGTPIYAVASGRIVKLKSKCPRGQKGESYNGGFGNEIIVACDGYIKPYNDDGVFQDFNTVYMQYAHLQYGNAIGYNYREGRPFQVGDKVQAGEIIGYTGNSGNAYNVPHPHLHYGISFDGDDQGNIVYHSWIDPAGYINGEIDLEQLKKDGENKITDGGRIKTSDCY